MLIRDMTVADVDGVYEIEKETFSDPWSKASFLESIAEPNNHYLVAIMEGSVVGYCGYWGIAGEGYIYNVAVKASHLRQGVGLRMLEELIMQAVSRGITSLTLEVRQSNEAAINLYKRLDFTEVGTRKDFYTKPLEDAIIMWRSPIH
ncbi:MAG: ribosomal protein S18-alanine N-acetyltransferase [Clostridiales bacterium]|jgi:ribosomal-protein-alanine N-acetyltransferase|nr:ribosomal protein S18-alanine N-acetyltransferase [Clostridiales bacterium]